MSHNTPKSYKRFDENINVKVDLSNYSAKIDIKNVTHIDASSFAFKKSWVSLKTEADKVDIEKL